MAGGGAGGGHFGDISDRGRGTKGVEEDVTQAIHGAMNEGAGAAVRSSGPGRTKAALLSSWFFLMIATLRSSALDTDSPVAIVIDLTFGHALTRGTYKHCFFAPHPPRLRRGG